jgi:hypothetical protein
VLDHQEGERAHTAGGRGEPTLRVALWNFCK